MGNKRYHVPPFICINWGDELSCLGRGRKVLGDMKYFIGSIKVAAEVVGTWAGGDWDVKRVN